MLVLDGELTLVNDFDGELGIIQQVSDSEHEIYRGDYVVKPKFEEQILETADKVMTDDVSVEAIYVSSVTNASGGKTVYIGGEINGEYL